MCSWPGDTATFTFFGTGVWLYGALRDNHGLYNVTLDGVTETRDGYGPGRGLYQQVLFSAVNLTPGQHIITLTNSRISSRFANLDLDFIIFEEEIGDETNTFGSNIVEDTDPAFTYGPALTAWSTIVENVSQYHGASGHTTTTTTGFVTYEFTGSTAQIYGALGPSQGPYSVQLDGGPIEKYTASNWNFFPQQLLWHVSGLDAGVHTVRLANMPDRAGQRLSIDYALAAAIHVPIATSSTSMSPTSSASSTSSESIRFISSASSRRSESSISATAAPVEGTSQLSSAPSTGVIAGAVVGSLVLLALLCCALVSFCRRRNGRNGRNDLDGRPDMAAVRPEPLAIRNGGYGGAGRYGPSPLHPPSRQPYDPNVSFPNGQNHDGASPSSRSVPGVQRGSGHSGSAYHQAQRGMSASTVLSYNQLKLNYTSPHPQESVYSANSGGASRSEHWHNALTEINEPPPQPLPPKANRHNLGLHSLPPHLRTSRIPLRKGQRASGFATSAAPDQSGEELIQQRVNVQGE